MTTTWKASSSRTSTVVPSGSVTSTATPIHRGRSQQVWVVETVDADGRVVARGQVRLQNLYPQG